MKTRKLLAFLLTTALLLGTAACGGSPGSTGSGQAPQSSAPAQSSPAVSGAAEPQQSGGDTTDTSGYADVLRVGVIQDLTGSASGFGIPIWNYLNMVVDEINANGGIDGKTKIELSGYDTGSSATDAISVYNRLISLEKVHAVIGSTISNEMIAVAPVAESSKIPTLSSSLDTKIVTNDDGTIRRYNFILQCTSVQQGYATAKYLIEEKGVKELAVVYNEGNAYCTAITKALIDCVEKHYSDVCTMTVVTYGANETDYGTYFSKAIHEKTDVLYCGCQFETAEILGQFRKLGYEMPVYGPNSYVPYAFELPEYAEGEVYYATGLDITTPEFADTNAAYREKYGSEIVAQAYQTCDGLYMLIEAYRAGGGSTDPETLVDNLKKVHVDGYQSDNYGFDENNCPDGVSLYLGHINDVANKTQETIAEMPVPNEWISLS